VGAQVGHPAGGNETHFQQKQGQNPLEKAPHAGPTPATVGPSVAGALRAQHA
jgi:hypothetical protein